VNVVVCVKLIPDPDSVGQLDATTHRLRRDLADPVLDPGAGSGVEAGLRLVEARGGEVRVVSMGPERALDAVRKALAMGATRGVQGEPQRARAGRAGRSAGPPIPISPSSDGDRIATKGHCRWQDWPILAADGR
jgi:hypothetical protein